MSVKRMILCPIYWGEWWVPARGNAYNWAEVSGLMANVVSGRYMDGLNQYGIGRGAVARTYVQQIDPPSSGFGDSNVHWLFNMALDNGLSDSPDAFDLASEQPFYCLIVKPGIEHLRDAAPGVPQWAPDTGTLAYHFEFSYDLGDGRPPWHGQACWVKGDTTAEGTVRRWVHEMAEAYSNRGEIADTCEEKPPVLVEHVRVPQYWSEADQACWPPGDQFVDVAKAIQDGVVAAGIGRTADKRTTTVDRARR